MTSNKENDEYPELSCTYENPKHVYKNTRVGIDTYLGDEPQ